MISNIQNLNHAKPGIIIPELILMDCLVNAFEFVRNELEDVEVPEEEKILYYIFRNNVNLNIHSLEHVDYYEEAKKLLSIRFGSDSNAVGVYLGYNLSVVSSSANIHILLPDETKSTMDGVGLDQGYVEDLLFDDFKRPVYTRSFTTTCSLVITSNSTNQIIILYNFLKSVLISLSPALELSGLRNMKFSGMDMIITQDLVPPNIYHRTLNITFDYEISVPEFFKLKKIKEYKINVNPLINNECIGKNCKC